MHGWLSAQGKRAILCQTRTLGASMIGHRRCIVISSAMFGFDRITHDPDILGGKACVRGMRISVSLIVNLVANGMIVEEIVDEYPDLEPEDIQQALRYAAWAAEDTVYMPAGVPA